MVKKNKWKSALKAKAHELGFTYLGVSKAEFLDAEAKKLDEWLSKGMHGKMTYMENNYDKRLDPSKLVPGAKSVISLMYNYYTDMEQEKSAPKISKYAYGEDYHFVLKRKLKELVSFIKEEIGIMDGRVFVDSAPVLERAWAKRAGLGWTGKNTQLINPKSGSFFFLAEIISDLDLEPDSPMKDYCGTCTACIDACPTEAIVAPYLVDGSRCISYFTIELKDEVIPSDYHGKFDNWMFGCDVCQDVCPWNRFSKPHSTPEFEPNEKMLEMSKRDWIELTEDVFQNLFKRSAVKRTKFNGLKRNIGFLE